MKNSRLVIGLIVLLLVCSCAHRAPKGKLVKVHHATLVITNAQSLYEAGEIDTAIAVLRHFVDSKIYHPSHDQAYELIVKWLLQLNKRPLAKRIATYFLSNHQTSSTAQNIIACFEENSGVANASLDQSIEEIYD